VEAIPADWTKIVAAEALRYAGKFATFDTLYLGGGTPSLLSENDLEGLVTSLKRVFSFQDDIESTIEVNPGDIDATRLCAMRKIGFNRLSVGIQSFCDHDLRLLGRRHNAAQAVEALISARKAGFDDMGLDLIFGIPDQTLQSWMTNLERAIDFAPEHISCYALSLEPGTPFAAAVAGGTMAPPDEAVQADMFMATSDFLEAHGYEHYEVSNFARGPEHRSRHNQKYWHHVPYLGLGPAAHSLQGNRRWWNYADNALWQAALKNGQSPIEGTEDLTRQQVALERIALGLRTRDGIPGNELPDTPDAQNALKQFIDQGLLTLCDDRIIPTRRGFLFADHLALQLS